MVCSMKWGTGEKVTIGYILLLNKEVNVIYVERKIQLDATQWFIELINRSTCFRHYYAHHQELETIQVITACGT